MSTTYNSFRLSNSILFVFALFVPLVVKCELLQRTNNNVQEVIDSNLLVAVLRYDDYCPNESAPSEFSNVARTAEESGIDKILNLKFVKINVREDSGRDYMFQMTCTKVAHMKLYKYGKDIDYRGSWNVREVMTWLENNTQPAVTEIKTDEQLQGYVKATEFSIVGYFKNFKTKLMYWRLASENKDYFWADVTNTTLHRSPETDVIIVNQEFGVSRLKLVEEITAENIKKFVKSNVNITGPVLELRDATFQDLIDRTLLVFVIFYDPLCPIPEYFEQAAQISQDNGLRKTLDMEFGKIDIKEEPLTRKKFNLTEDCTNYGGLKESWRKMKLFRYGKAINYGTTQTGLIWKQDTETLQGLFSWLEKNTKPAARLIQTDREFNELVYYTQVTILGYFKPGSKEKINFWSLADTLTNYTWAAVINPQMNPFEIDTIVINQEFGGSYVTLNKTLTKKDIEAFVEQNANSTFPVPTRPLPTIRPDLDPQQNVSHYQRNVAYIYNKPFYYGDFKEVDLSKGCFDVDWTYGALAVNTFGRCVVVYESYECESPKSEQIILDSKNPEVHNDLATAGYGLTKMILSLQSCDREKSYSVSSASFSFTQLFPSTVFTFTILWLSNSMFK